MIRINLLPVREARRAATLRNQGILLGAAAAAAVVLCVLVHITMTARVAGVHSSLREKQAELKKLEKTQAEVKRYQDEKAEIEAKLGVIVQIEKQRTGPVRIMDEIATRIPKRVWINKLSAQNGRLELEGSSLDAEIVAEFLKGLEESPMISQVELVETTLQEESGLKINKFKLKSAYPTVKVLADQGPAKTPKARR